MQDALVCKTKSIQVAARPPENKTLSFSILQSNKTRYFSAQANPTTHVHCSMGEELRYLAITEYFTRTLLNPCDGREGPASLTSRHSPLDCLL